MLFKKDEIIKLTDDKEYLILDTLLIDNEFYYKIQEVNEESNELIGDIRYITANEKEGEKYINENIPEYMMIKLKELFED